MRSKFRQAEDNDILFKRGKKNTELIVNTAKNWFMGCYWLSYRAPSWGKQAKHLQIFHAEKKEPVISSFKLESLSFKQAPTCPLKCGCYDKESRNHFPQLKETETN